MRSLDGSVQDHRCCYLPPFSHVGALVQHSSIYVAVTKHTTQLPRFEIPAHHRTCQVLNSHTHAKVKQLLSPRQSRGFSLRNNKHLQKPRIYFGLSFFLRLCCNLYSMLCRLAFQISHFYLGLVTARMALLQRHINAKWFREETQLINRRHLFTPPLIGHMRSLARPCPTLSVDLGAQEPLISDAGVVGLYVANLCDKTCRIQKIHTVFSCDAICRTVAEHEGS